jgi:hypothetical protein
MAGRQWLRHRRIRGPGRWLERVALTDPLAGYRPPNDGDLPQ